MNINKLSNSLLTNILKFSCFQKEFLFNKTVEFHSNHSFFNMIIENYLYISLPIPKSFTCIFELDFTHILYFFYSQIEKIFFIKNKKNIIKEVVLKKKKENIFVIFVEKNLQKILLILILLYFLFFYKKLKKKIEINKKKENSI